MELKEGWIKDLNEVKSVPGSWPFARNIVIEKVFRSPMNERGFNLEHEFTGNVIAQIATNDEIVAFINTGATSQIVVIRGGIETVILQDVALNFSTEFPIKAVYTYNFNQELIVAWWEGVEDAANVPRILNLDCLPFDTDAAGNPLSPDFIEKIKLFPDNDCVQFSLLTVNDGGGSLETGVYHLAFAYLLADGSQTNYSQLFGPVAINEESSVQSFDQIDGAAGGTASGKSISFQAFNVDQTFDKLRVAVVKRIGGVISAVQLPDIDIKTATINVTYTDDSEVLTLSVDEVIIPKLHIDKVKAGTVLDNRLYLGNFTELKPIEWQQYANAVRTDWRHKVVEMTKFEGSHKDPTFLFTGKGFQPGSPYNFYAWFIRKNGQPTKAFHIPGRAVRQITVGVTNIDENDLVQDLIDAGETDNNLAEAVLVDPDVRYYQMFDTSKDAALNQQNFGFWENEDEIYPDEDCSDVFDVNGQVIGTLRGEKVRHHVFPTVKKMEDLALPFIGGSQASPVNWATLEPDVWDAFRFLEWTLTNDGTGGSGTFSFNNSSYTFDTKKYIRVKSDVGITNIRNFARFTVQVTNSAGDVIKVFYDSGQINGSLAFPKSAGAIIDESFTFNPGDRFELNFDIDPFLLYNGDPTTSGEMVLDDLGFETLDVSSTVLGVQFRNVIIPQSIADEVTCIVFGYAQRGIEDITRIGHSVIIGQDWNPDSIAPDTFDIKPNFRSHGFDLLNGNPAVGITHIETELLLGDGSDDRPFISATNVVDHKIRALAANFYVPTDVTLPIDNSGREEIFAGEVQNNLAVAKNYFPLGWMCIWRKNVYLAYTGQKPAALAYSQEITGATVLVSTAIYGADTHTSMYGVHVKPKDVDRFETLYYPVVSIANIGLRHEDLADGLQYFPKSLDIAEDQTTNSKAYNEDYSAINNIVTPQVYDCRTDCAVSKNVFPHKVARSVVNNREEYELKWRQFLGNDTYESVKNKGEIWNLEVLNKSLLIHHKWALFIASDRDSLVTEDEIVNLAEGDVFDSVDEVIPAGGGFAGTQSKFAAFTCKAGYVFVDQQDGKVYIFDGSIKEISNAGLSNFLKTQLPHGEFDNPVGYTGLVGWYDDFNRRILFTKISRNGLDGTVTPTQSFTISYSLVRNTWVALHDYLPSTACFSRLGVFTTDSSDRGNVYKHNDERGRGTFYNGVIYPSYIDALFNENPSIEKIFSSIAWITTATNRFGGTLRNTTFTHVLVYNGNQVSGQVTLSKKQFVSLQGNIRPRSNTWYFNDFRDMIVDRDDAILDNFGNLIASNVTNSKPYFEKSKFVSKFIVVRFIFDNQQDVRVMIDEVFINPKISNR